MWQIENHTPYAAERGFMRDRDGAEYWLVTVKGSFDVEPDGIPRLADHQQPVQLVPKYHGTPGRSSLLSEVDLDFPKQATDVVLIGEAWAPGGRPVASLDVRLQVDNREKVLRVFGPRIWRRRLGVGLGAPEPFSRMPLIYENAFGGASTSNSGEVAWARHNPVGRGFAVDAEQLIGQIAPTVEDPNNLMNSWKSRPLPVGFGPIARDWAPRITYAGTYDERWQRERHPLLPVDFDERFRQCAPVNQQFPGRLRGGEVVLLSHLAPEPEQRWVLPKIWLTFRTSFGRERVEHRATLNTVLLEPTQRRVTLVWATAVRCQNKEHHLEKTVIREKLFR